jgi:tetratricopeptide (TPR) repeat protein
VAEKKRMKIQLLGTPKMFWDEKSLTIHRKLARFLIYYLSMQKVMLGRTEIMLDFWPESLNSRQHLRDLLSKTRQELPDPNILVTDRDWVGVDHSRVEVDAIEFEELYQQLTLPFLFTENHPLPETVFQKMIFAVNLWETPNILSGSSALRNDGLEDWIHKNNKRLQAMRLDLIMRISRHLIAVGDLEGACAWLEQLIALDFDYEYPGAVFLKIETLFRMQKYAAAYMYGQSLIEEMGYDWFGGQESPLRSLMSQLEELRFRTQEISAVTHSSQHSKQVPITGRENLLRDLQRAAQRSGIVFLKGEAGSGKTRILEEFLSQYHPTGKILHMHGSYFQRELPYHPVLDSFRESLKVSDWRSLEAFWGRQLIPLFPELQQYWSTSLSDDNFLINSQMSSMEALHQLLQRISMAGKVTIILDDAHWADADTLNLMIYLAQRHFFHEKGFLIISFRPDVENRILKEMPQLQRRMDEITMLEIEPLKASETSQIGYSIFRKPISDSLSKRINSACGGNALFVIETLQALVEQYGLLDESRIVNLPLAGIVHAILRNQIKALSSPGAQIAECAAIAGEPFTFSTIKAVLDLDENDLINGLDELIRSGLLTVEVLPLMRNQYHFKYGFLREVAALETSIAKKETLHLRMAKALEQALQKNDDSQLLAKIAAHYSGGGEPVIAFNYWIRLAQSLQSSSNEPPAFEAYQNAQNIADALSNELSTAQLYDLYIGWGDLALYRYELDVADSCFKKATIEGQKRNDPYLLSTGYSGLGELFGIRGIYYQANQFLDYANNFLDEKQTGEFIRIKNRKAYLLLQQSMPEHAITLLQGVSSCFSNAASKFDHVMVAESYYYLAIAHLYAGEFREAFAACAQTSAILKNYHYPPLQSKVELIYGRIAYSRGYYQKALEHYGLSLQIAEFYSAWNLALQATIYSSYVSIKQGRVFHSWDQIKNGFHLSEVYKYSGCHGLLFNAQARIFLYLGKLELAREYFEKALSYSQSKFMVVFNQKDLGFTQFLLGDEEMGLNNMDEAVHLSRLYGFHSLELIAESEIILLKYHKNRQSCALNELQALTEKAKNMEISGAGTSYAYIGALEAIRNKDFQQAETLIQYLEETGALEGSLWFHWHAHELRIQLHHAQGLDTRADQLKRLECLREIKQMVPKDIKRTIELKTPPLSGLV